MSNLSQPLVQALQQAAKQAELEQKNKDAARLQLLRIQQLLAQKPLRN